MRVLTVSYFESRPARYGKISPPRANFELREVSGWFCFFDFSKDFSPFFELSILVLADFLVQSGISWEFGY